MVGWHHRLDGRDFEKALGDSGGQGSLACCSSWGSKQLDITKQLKNNNNNKTELYHNPKHAKIRVGQITLMS